MEKIQSSYQIYDSLKANNDSWYKKTAQKKIYVSTKCNEYDKKNRIHYRILLITAQEIILVRKGFLGRRVQRKTPLICIKGVVYSNESQEFVLLIPTQFDYRLSISGGHRDIIINTLTHLYCLGTGKKLKFYFIDKVHLRKFATTEDDLKMKRPRRDPQTQPVEVDTSVFQNINDGKIFLSIFNKI